MRNPLASSPASEEEPRSDVEASSSGAQPEFLVRRVAAVQGQEMLHRTDRGENFVLEPGTVWVTADNRSLPPEQAPDSRVFGPLPLENVMGRVIFRWVLTDPPLLHSCMHSRGFRWVHMTSSRSNLDLAGWGCLTGTWSATANMPTFTTAACLLERVSATTGRWSRRRWRPSPRSGPRRTQATSGGHHDSPGHTSPIAVRRRSKRISGRSGA